jgi:hypothetical protein
LPRIAVYLKANQVSSSNFLIPRGTTGDLLSIVNLVSSDYRTTSITAREIRCDETGITIEGNAIIARNISQTAPCSSDMRMTLCEPVQDATKRDGILAEQDWEIGARIPPAHTVAKNMVSVSIVRMKCMSMPGHVPITGVSSKDAHRGTNMVIGLTPKL